MLKLKDWKHKHWLNSSHSSSEGEMNNLGTIEDFQMKELAEHSSALEHQASDAQQPTEEESKNLRRIVGHIPWACYIICLVEFAERGSYYGTGDRLSNFIQRPLPPNSPHGTGAVAKGDNNSSSGALGAGLQKASAMTLLLSFFAYVTPLMGGYLADKKWGRFKTLWIGVWVGCLSHIIFLIASIPQVIKAGDAALAPIVIGILTLAWGSGFIKPNLLPLLMDQYPYLTDVVIQLPSGEKVIVDKDASLQRITSIFYAAVNIGSFLSLGTSYAAKNIGFWLAFLVPMILYLTMFPVLILLDNKLKKEIPSGTSVLEDFFKVIKVTFESGWISRFKNGTLWEYAKPSNLMANGRTSWRKSGKGTFGYTDEFVEDTRITLDACKIFFFYIIYNINDSQLSSLQISQASSLHSAGVPNDLMSNFNSLTIIVCMPILMFGLFPLFLKLKINYRPVYRIFTGFIICSLCPLAGAIIQWRIYAISPCGNHSTNCPERTTLSLWVELSMYVATAISECFAMTTAYEIAYTRSPEQMKGVVMALFLFTSAISAAIAEAITGAMVDPKLPSIFIGLFAAGVAMALIFLALFRNLHKTMEKEEEEKLAKRIALLEKSKQMDSVGFQGKDNLSLTSVNSAVGVMMTADLR